VPEYWCYKRDQTATCTPFTQAAIDEFQKLLTPCLR
jgi:hypothetical protein